MPETHRENPCLWLCDQHMPLFSPALGVRDGEWRVALLICLAGKRGWASFGLRTREGSWHSSAPGTLPTPKASKPKAEGVETIHF